MLTANSNSHSMDLIRYHCAYGCTMILGSMLLSCSRLRTFEHLLQRFCAPDQAPSPCVKQRCPPNVHLRTASFQAHTGSTADQHISAVIPKELPKAASRTKRKAEHAEMKPHNLAISTALMRSTSKQHEQQNTQHMQPWTASFRYPARGRTVWSWSQIAKRAK